MDKEEIKALIKAINHLGRKLLEAEKQLQSTQSDAVVRADIENLEDKAAIFLEESFVSGDTMIEMDHDLDNLPEGMEKGSYYLHDLLALFAEQLYNKFKKDNGNRK